MKLTVVHDEHGHIIALSKVVDLKQVGSKFAEVASYPEKVNERWRSNLPGSLTKCPCEKSTGSIAWITRHPNS